MRTMNFFRLDFLSKDEGWRLFKQCALCDDKNLKEIGKKIAEKCGGLPLAIKLLGSHLRFESDEDKWMCILESELSDLDPGSSEILPALRLSYERMPSHLKPCFRYCSMFPTKKIPSKNHLVWMWMAQGYIQSKITGKTMEEIGREYFDELLERSFFLVEGFADSFRMHDLIFDLAIFIFGNEFITKKLESGNQNIHISNNVRHIALQDYLKNNEVLEDILVYPSISRQVSLRSLFYHGRSIAYNFQLLYSMSLRALHIEMLKDENQNILQFVGSISLSKNLRYLYISCQKKWIIRFPERDPLRLFNASHSIYNLQVLNLHNFSNPIMLSSTTIRNLNKLPHLLLPYGSYMPCGISKLTCLQTLKHVAIKDGSFECGGLGEIEDLASLTGSCCIEGIKYAPDIDCFKKANITRKKHIWRPVIDWSQYKFWYKNSRSFDVCIHFVKNVIERRKIEQAKAILEALQPHKNLKELEIVYYPGIQFPLWLGDPSWSKLRDITLKSCGEWDGSGRVLDRDLPCLRSISIIDCAKLKNIKIVQSSSLSRLHIEECPEITTLHGLYNLHGLKKLEIISCYNLLISKEEILPSKLHYVCFKDCWNLTSITGLQNLHSLEKLNLIRCPKLKLSLEEQLSTMPGVLEIASCPGLEEWCQIYGFNNIQDTYLVEELAIENTCEIISNDDPMNLFSLQNLHIVGSDESDFSKIGWIPSNLHTLHLISCQRMVFFPPYQNLFKLRLFKIGHCTALKYLPVLERMESLRKLEIIDCPQIVLSVDYSLPSKLHFLFICNYPRLFNLPGLEQLFSLKNLKLFECSELMLPPPEQLRFMHHVQLELFNSPKLIDWCQRYDVPYNNKESPNDLFVRNDEQIELWLEETSEFFENICVLDYDGVFLEVENWNAFRIVAFYICSCDHLKHIILKKNFTRLKQLRIWDCSYLEELDGLHNVTTLQDMDISNCPNLDYLTNFPKSLQCLAIYRCNKLFGVNCLGTNLSSLEISSCSTLDSIYGLQNLVTLHFLKIDNCPQLRPICKLLPDTLNPNNIEISACPQLQEWCQGQDVAYYRKEAN